MDNLCTTCLCAGRTLISINETELYQLFTQIINKPISDILGLCLRVCWECRAILNRFQRFKKQAQCCYTELLRHIEQNPAHVHDLYKSSSLQIQPVETVDFPLTLPKEEDTTHDEPAAFVADIKLEKKRRKAKIKKITKQKKRKVKIKKEIPEKDYSDFSYADEAPGEAEAEAAGEACGECGRQFDSREQLEAHVALECAEVKPPVAVANGAKPARAREELPERPECAECGKVFSSRKTYRYHINVLHKGQNRYPCPRCGKVYQWKSNLGRHMRTHKARDSGELHCGTCDKWFASVATFRQHLKGSRRHISERDFRFMCNECGKKFVNKTRLRDHIDWEHLHKIKFKCQLCDKAFKCHTSLYVHLQNVHRDKDKKDNLCHVCGKSYQNAAKLRYHIVAMHTSDTPYRCDRCGAAFGWYSSLYRHAREVHDKLKIHPKKTKKSKKLSNEILLPHPLLG